MTIGHQILNLAKTLWPIPRSLTGNGVRQTLSIISDVVGGLEIKEVPSGTKCFDWEVPKEWNIKDAYIVGPEGEKFCEFKKLNLHVVGYSQPIDKRISLPDLQRHLYSMPQMPEAVPYVTSYYKEGWGFCISENERKKLREGEYRVFIDSELKEGALTYAEAFVPGKSEKEVLISTYVCHPQMANNELSGPCVTAYILKWLRERKSCEYSYRFVFIPETIGSIVYLSSNLEVLKKRLIAGFNVTCVGDDRAYSYLPSRNGETLSDKVVLHVLKHIDPNFVKYTFLDRGSDERQYCAPGIDLPIASLMRTKYMMYPEYHTSLDNFDVVTASGLQGGYTALKKCIEVIESNKFYKVTVLGEPQLGKRGLYPTISTIETHAKVKNMMNFLAYADGEHSLLQIAEILNISVFDLVRIIEPLEASGLVRGFYKTEE